MKNLLLTMMFICMATLFTIAQTIDDTEANKDGEEVTEAGSFIRDLVWTDCEIVITPTGSYVLWKRAFICYTNGNQECVPDC